MVKEQAATPWLVGHDGGPRGPRRAAQVVCCFSGCFLGVVEALFQHLGPHASSQVSHSQAY